MIDGRFKRPGSLKKVPNVTSSVPISWVPLVLVVCREGERATDDGDDDDDAGVLFEPSNFICRV